MEVSKIIYGRVGPRGTYTEGMITEEDYGILFQMPDLDLPAAYQVDFSNKLTGGTALTVVGNEGGALIPTSLIDSGKDVYAFLYYTGVGFGKTTHVFRINNNRRAKRGTPAPSPEQQSVIDQTIAALNDAVAQTAQDVIDAGASARSAKEYAEQAESARDTAQGYASNAQLSATQANNSAISANQSASASAQSASQSAQIKADVEGMVSNAQGYANSASQSANASANSASDAQGYAQSASASASSASGYASSAQTSANTASSKATEASTSAQTASQKATEASQSASQALSYKTDAESAKTASETAQGLAESARDDAITAKTSAESARNEAQDIVDGITNKIEQIDSNTERIESLEDDRYKPYPTDAASGSVASFPDGADGIPLKSCIVQIEPVQDLHGYDHPWPAGGGVNKIDYLSCVGVGARNGTDSVYGNNTSISGTELTINQSYGDNGGILKGIGTFPLATGEYVTISGKATLTGTSGLVVGISNYDGGGTNNIQVNATVTNGRFSVKLNAKSDYAKTGIFLQPQTPGSTAVVSDVMVALGQTEQPYSPYSNICPITGWTGCEVKHSGADTSNPTTYPITFPTEAGTVYGGSLTISEDGSGVLTVKGQLDTITVENNEIVSSLFNWSAGGTPTILTDCVRMAFNRNSQSSNMQIVSNNYEYKQCNYLQHAFNYNLGVPHWYINNQLYVYLPVSAVDTTKESWVSYFAEHPLTIYVPYANPIVYNLTAAQITTLLGQNNVWADSGDSEVEYRADTKLYIQKKIAEAISALS